MKNGDDMKTRYRMSSEQILQIIKMRQEGYSLNDIGHYFQKDHTTILYHCQKAGLSMPRTPRGSKRIMRIQCVLHDKFGDMEDEGPRNLGKNYADYLDEENGRKWKKRKDIAMPS